METRYHSIRIEEQEKTKAIVIEGLLEGTIEQLRGRDASQPVTFENMFNQIHATSQVIATGSTKYNDGVIAVDTDGTHSLYSNFSWSVS